MSPGRKAMWERILARVREARREAALDQAARDKRDRAVARALGKARRQRLLQRAHQARGAA